MLKQVFSLKEVAKTALTGLDYRVSRRGLVYVSLPIVSSTKDEIVYDVVQHLPTHHIVANVGEYGCRPVANVVCGLSGRPLRPYRTGGIPCGVHATFAILGGWCDIRADLEQYKVTVSRFTIDTGRVKSGKAIVHIETLYDGIPEFLPAALRAYKPAVDAAMRKAQARQCAEAFYAATD